MKEKKHIVYTAIMAVLFFGLSFFCWFKPADDFSWTERRPLDQFPKLNMQTLLNGSFMSKFEEYTLDQFPMRDQFRSMKAAVAFYILGQKDNNDIYMVGDYVSEMEYPLHKEAVSQSMHKFASIAEQYFQGTGVKLYHAVIPDKNYFLAADNGYLSIDYEALFQQVKEEGSFMEYIDIVDLLQLEDYYYTDTHWQQQSIIAVAEALADAMGAEVKTSYEEHTLDTPFYGVYYGQLGLPVNPDHITYLTNPILESCLVYDHQNNKEMPMYDLDKAVGRDPYEMYLGGSLSVVTIENPAAATDKELVIFRDSFGSSIAPLLVDGYKKITLLDARYLHQNIIGNYVEFTNQDVLFLHSASVLNNPSAFK